MFPRFGFFAASIVITLLILPIASAITGFTGPGTYSITNAGNNMRAGLWLGGSIFNFNQFWDISIYNSSSSSYQLVNNGTGTFMSAPFNSVAGVNIGAVVNNTVSAVVQALSLWIISPVTQNSNAVTIENVEFLGNVLDAGGFLDSRLSATGEVANQVVLNPIVEGLVTWVMQLAGALAGTSVGVVTTTTGILSATTASLVQTASVSVSVGL